MLPNDKIRLAIREIMATEYEIKEDNLQIREKPIDDESLRTDLMKVLNISKAPEEEILKKKEEYKKTIQSLIADLNAWSVKKFGDKII